MRRVVPARNDTIERWGLMFLIREFEGMTYEMKIAGEVAGSVHLGTGQEAVAVGVCAGLSLPADVLFATYRGHAWALACGSAPRALFAELLGRESGVNGGRGGSAYLTDPSVGFMGENSIVGAGVSHAVGAALRGRFDGTQRRAVAVVGDGALNQGAVHEALNFAAYKELPLLLVVENNGYSEMTPINDMVAEPQLWTRAAGYGIRGTRIDGNDTYALSAEVAAWRSGATVKPLLIEAMTQRLVGHYVGDPEVYRTRGAIDALSEVEPLGRVRRQLEVQGVGNARLVAIEASIRSELSAALDWARNAPFPAPESSKDHVHA